MNIQLTNNVVTLTTGIKAVDFNKGIADYKLVNAKDKSIDFEVVMSEQPCVSKFKLGCNAEVDGELAVVIVEKVGIQLEDVKKKYGPALVVIAEQLETLIAQTSDAVQAVESIFAAQ